MVWLQGRSSCFFMPPWARVSVVRNLGKLRWPRRATAGFGGALAVTAAALIALPAEPQRLWCTSERAWIYRGPSRQQALLGSLLRGDVVALKSSEHTKGSGCSQGFLEIEPRGFICDDFAVKTAENDRSVRALKSMGAVQGPYPFHFAISDYAPLYRRIPTSQEAARIENPLGPPGTVRVLDPGNRGHERLAERRPIPADSPMPWFLAHGGSLRTAEQREPFYKLAPLGSTLAYVGAFEAGERTWLYSFDGSVIPADRVRPFRRSEFRGVILQAPFELPIAWLPRQGARRWHRDTDGFHEVAQPWPQRTAVPLDGDAEPANFKGKRYLKTRECTSTGQCAWVAEKDAAVARALKRMWWGSKPEERSIVVSITNGTLVAYDGPRPVFTTLVSPGVGGVPREGVDPVRASTTPLGVYRVTYKVLHTTMSPEDGDPQRFWMAEVPHTQYFNMPFALHAAYWHEEFGLPMSAGCINLSPLDAEWLFAWTLPAVPSGWGGATTSKENGLGSFVVVTR